MEGSAAERGGGPLFIIPATEKVPEESRMCFDLMSYLSPAGGARSKSSVRILLRVSLLTSSRFFTAGDGSEPKPDSKCVLELI